MAGTAHPSKKFFLIALAFLLMALVFSIFAIVVPSWSRIPTAGINDIGNAWLMKTAGKAVTSESKLYVGHWEWCLYYSDSDNSYTCSKILLGDDSPPSFGNMKCKGFLYGSRIMAILASATIFIALVATGLTFKKVAAYNSYVWSPPSGPAMAGIFTTLLAFGILCTSWAMWIEVAEHPCRTNSMVWNPFQGYSTSFIVEVFASGFTLIALIAAFLGFKNLKKVPEVKAVPVYDDVVEVVEVVDAVTY